MVYLKLIGLIVLSIGLVVLLPIATIWAVNTLFPSIVIPYTFETWAATMILGVFFRGISSSSKG